MSSCMEWEVVSQQLEFNFCSDKHHMLVDMKFHAFFFKLRENLELIALTLSFCQWKFCYNIPPHSKLKEHIRDTVTAARHDNK